MRVDDPKADAIETGDRLLYIRSAGQRATRTRGDVGRERVATRKGVAIASAAMRARRVATRKGVAIASAAMRARRVATRKGKRVDFQLQNVPLLSRVGADRADQLRTDIDAAVAGWADAAVLRVDSRNQVLIADGRVVLGGAGARSTARRRRRRVPRPHRGRQARVGDPRAAGRHPRTPTRQTLEVLDLRRGGTDFDDISAQLVASATALLNWHDNARFSADRRVADQTGQGAVGRGSTRVTGHEEFPRIDPAVICLVHDGADRVVLARQTVWPERMFSLLAGFVEAGESFEIVRGA